MAVRDILLLGNPRLYEISEAVRQGELHVLRNVVTDLHDTLMDFRKVHGAGRAIAAPQIGVMKRLIYMHCDEPVVFINPVLQGMSMEMIDVWDDCLSFPDLVVKVKRHKSCTILFTDMDWNSQELVLADDLSELLQHEYDHLEGILAVSRAIDGRSFAFKSQRDLLV
jgi:peptide deformylase